MQPFRVLRGQSKISDVIRQMMPAHGEESYDYLSDMAHGGPTAVLRTFALTQAGAATASLDQWRRMRIAAGALITACRAVADLRGRELPSPWPELATVHDRYGGFIDTQTYGSAANESANGTG